jgi:hypothetical protein
MLYIRYSRYSHMFAKKMFLSDASAVAVRIGQNIFFIRDLLRDMETVTTEVLSSRNGKEKEDGIGESQPVREEPQIYIFKLIFLQFYLVLSNMFS